MFLIFYILKQGYFFKKLINKFAISKLTDTSFLKVEDKIYTNSNTIIRKVIKWRNLQYTLKYILQYITVFYNVRFNAIQTHGNFVTEIVVLGPITPVLIISKILKKISVNCDMWFTLLKLF